MKYKTFGRHGKIGPCLSCKDHHRCTYNGSSPGCGKRLDEHLTIDGVELVCPSEYFNNSKKERISKYKGFVLTKEKI